MDSESIFTMLVCSLCIFVDGIKRNVLINTEIECFNNVMK